MLEPLAVLGFDVGKKSRHRKKNRDKGFSKHRALTFNLGAANRGKEQELSGIIETHFNSIGQQKGETIESPCNSEGGDDDDPQNNLNSIGDDQQYINEAEQDKTTNISILDQQEVAKASR